MVGPRWRKVLRDLSGNKTRTMLVVLSVAVGIFAIGVITSIQVVLPRDLNASYLATNPASATVFTEPFDQDLVAAVRGMEQVRYAEGRSNLATRMAVGPGAWRSIQLFAIPDFDALQVNKVTPVAGAWPPPKHALLIERSALELTNASIGSQIQIELPSGKQRALQVAGLVHDIGQRPPFFTGTIYGYITFDTLEWLTGTRDFNELRIVVADGAHDWDHVRAVAEEVRAKVEKSGRKVFWVSVPRPFSHPVEEAMQAMIFLLGALGVLSFLLSGFLVANTVSALLTQQTRQIAVMKAIGGSNGQLIGMYLSVVLIFGLLALVVALPLGALGAYLVSNFAARLLNFDLAGFSIPLRALVFQLIVGLLVPVLAALYPIWSGVRMTIREALAANGLGTTHFGGSLIDRLLERVRGLSRPVMLSLRNTFRRKGRLALTLITLSLGGATFIAVTSVRDSTLLTIEDFADYWNYDVLVNFSHPQRTLRIETEARRVPGVKAVESWGYVGARRIRPDQTEGDNIVMVAPPATTRLLQPTVVEGRWLLPGDEVAIVVNTDVLQDEPDIKLGDHVVFNVAGHELTWRVVGVVRGVLAGPLVYVNYPYFAQAVSEVGRAESIRVVTDDHSAGFQAYTAQALEDHFKRLGVRISSRQTSSEARVLIESQFDVLIMFLLIMALLLALVGGLGLMGTVSINVLERTREIGVMRAIGASDIDILKVVLGEGVVIGVLSWICGTLVAIPLSKFMSDRVGMAFTQSPLTYTFSVAGMLLWLIIVILLAVLASLPPALSAARIAIRDALAYE